MLKEHPGDLNYPSFSIILSSDQSLVKYKRVVTNVGSNADAVYKVNVTAQIGVEISVSPSELVFNDENQRVGYDGGERYGSIKWIDGSHLMRSPVAQTRDKIKSPKTGVEGNGGGVRYHWPQAGAGGRRRKGLKFVVYARFRFQRLIQVPFIVL
ncbi:hypothetical protein DVH24_027608 [Malus domestica]|uniref:Subtilisin-like protease fibronectin type-III domain-containing protein n=1 Tax=Malus domestica TaxID=3750 RepID=A0A498HEA9_MALDO|nr:hypothetical protein DVH24_027608 [Malus domestica]